MHAHKNQGGKNSNDKAKVKTRGKQKDKGPNYSNATISLGSISPLLRKENNARSWRVSFCKIGSITARVL